MTTGLDDLLGYLQSIIQQWKRFKEEDRVEDENEDLAWNSLVK